MNTVSLVVPVYNERERLEKTFKALKQGFSFSGFKLEQLIFVNDGSEDQTLALLKKERLGLQKKLRAKVVLVSYKQNRGKGYAVKQGMLVSTADYTLLFDADMSTPLPEFKKFIPFIKKGYQVIVGTRKNGHSTVIKHQPIVREVLGKGFTLLSNVILNTWVTDFTCGFKLFSYKAKQAIWSKAKVERWGYDSEILFLARKYGFKMTEKAVSWSNDERSKVHILQAVFTSLADLINIRLFELEGQYSLSENKASLLKPFWTGLRNFVQ